MKVLLFWCVCTLALVGCGPSGPPSPPPAESTIAGDAEELKEEIAQLKDEVAELQSKLDDFDNLDWQEVVPEVKTAADDVENRLVSLESAADRVADSANEITDGYEDAEAEAEADRHYRP